ncbi:MAG: hypothetical protein GYA46_12360, partial [candidate division Zixibacteria bacterium]|nr:hypothetical protein [candidate division Zixibacteria bacterium]
IALAEKGVNIILTGLLPRYDELGRENDTLAKALHMKTPRGESVGEVEYGKGQLFTSYLFGTIRSTDPKGKKLALVKDKVVGMMTTRFKGKVFLFTHDLASGGDFRKLYHLESILDEIKLKPAAFVSDPNVEVVFQKGEKAFVIFLLAPPAGELRDATDVRSKEILLKVDLRRLGYKGAKIKLVDQFADEETPPIKTTVDDLKNGISLKMDFPDGKILLVEKM